MLIISSQEIQTRQNEMKFLKIQYAARRCFNAAENYNYFAWLACIVSAFSIFLPDAWHTFIVNGIPFIVDFVAVIFQADWDIIRQVKEAVSIPVIGNGDVTSPQKAEELVKQTGCDGIMIARGAQGNPWIFSEMITYEETGTLPERPGKEEVRDMMLRHARLQLKYKGEFIGIREMRKHVAWYTKGLKGSAKLREEINRVESYQELEELLFQRLYD